MAASASFMDSIKRSVFFRRDVQASAAVVLAGLGLAAYLFQYQQAKIAAATRAAEEEEKRLSVGKEVVSLDKRANELSVPFTKKNTSIDANRFEAMAVDNKLKFISAVQDKERDFGFYKVLPFAVAVEGGYHSIASFISALESRPEVIKIEMLSVKHKVLSEAPQEEGQSVEAQALLADMVATAAFLK